MRLRNLPLFPVILLVGLILLPVSDATAATSPGFTISASNVSLSDTGSGSSAYTITSVGGFSGQVGVSCFAPELDGSLVIPNCDIAEQFLTVPANGSVSGKMPFTPPSTVTASNDGGGRPRPAGPITAGAILLAGFAVARGRRRWNRALAPVALLATLFAGLSATGCGGHGGLAMSRGTWGYSIQAAGPGAKVATAYINVTVQ